MTGKIVNSLNNFNLFRLFDKTKIYDAANFIKGKYIANNNLTANVIRFCSAGNAWRK